MVQKYQSPVRVYKYPFELVMAAYERRFPTCELIPVLVSTDIISEETTPDGAIQIIERRCKLNVEAPYLLKKMAGVDYFYCIQRNTLNRRERTLKIEAWNETFAKRIIINEYCTYSVHPENASWTCFEQSASLEVKSLFGFETTAEKIAVKHYAASIEKGKEIIELYVEKLKEEENISFIPTYSDSHSHSDDGGKDRNSDLIMTSDRNSDLLISSDRLMMTSSDVDRDSVLGLSNHKEQTRTPLPSDELSMDYIDEDGRSGKSDRTENGSTTSGRDCNSSSGKGSGILNNS